MSFFKKWDKGLLLTVGLLTLWGIINFYSVSTIISERNLGDKYGYLIEFVFKNIILASFAFLIFSSLNWKFLKRISLPIFIIFFIFLLLAFLPGFRPSNQTTSRWIDLKIFSFQPTEFLKLAMLLWLAFLMPHLQKNFKSSYERSFILILILGVISIFIYMQPTLSNLLIIWASIGAGYLSLKPKIKELVPFLLIIIVFLALSPLWGYRINRVISYLNKNDTGAIDFQKMQSTRAIGSGGLFGIGIGNSKIKLLGIPLIINDSIFAPLAEEVGFVGSIVLISIFIILILLIAGNAAISTNPEKRFFAYGVMTWISLQAFIHIASNLGIIPTTGIPLPFFSYGSSSQIALMSALGIINNLKNS